MVQRYKLECHLKKMDCCVQGQGHSEGFKCQQMFVQMISPEPFQPFVARHMV